MSIRDKSYNTDHLGRFRTSKNTNQNSQQLISGSETIDMLYENGEIVFNGNFTSKTIGATGSLLIDTKKDDGWFLSSSYDATAKTKSAGVSYMLFTSRAHIGDQIQFYGKYRYTPTTASLELDGLPHLISTFTAVTGSGESGITWNTGSDSGSAAQNFIDVVNQFNSVSGSITKKGKFGLHISASISSSYHSNHYDDENSPFYGISDSGSLVKLEFQTPGDIYDKSDYQLPDNTVIKSGSNFYHRTTGSLYVRDIGQSKYLNDNYRRYVFLHGYEELHDEETGSYQDTSDLSNIYISKFTGWSNDERYKYSWKYSDSKNLYTGSYAHPQGILNNSTVIINNIKFRASSSFSLESASSSIPAFNRVVYYDKGYNSGSAAQNLRDAINNYNDYNEASYSFAISASYEEGAVTGSYIRLYRDAKYNKFNDTYISSTVPKKLNESIINIYRTPDNSIPITKGLKIGHQFYNAQTTNASTASLVIKDSGSGDNIFKISKNEFTLNTPKTDQGFWKFKNDGTIEYSKSGTDNKVIVDVVDKFKIYEKNSSSGDEDVFVNFQPLTSTEKTSKFSKSGVSTKRNQNLDDTTRLKSITFEDGTTRDSAKESYYTYHTFYYTGNNKVYVPISSTSEGTTISHRKFIAPHDGELEKIMISTDGWSAAPGSTSIGFHKNESTTATSTQSTTINSTNTTSTVTFTSSNDFDAGDRISISVDSAKAPYLVTMTCVWKYDTTT